LLCALAAFGWWGVVPAVYFKALATIPALDILAFRIVWSLPLLALLLAATRQLPQLTAVLHSRRFCTLLLLTTTLISINWFVYIYGVVHEQIVQTSLGYFINPLVNVVLGLLIFRERLRVPQWTAVAHAALGVVLLTFAGGEFPWIALTLAVSFGCYGMVRKLLPLDSTVCLAVEVLLLVPASLGYLAWLFASGQGALVGGDWWINSLLALGGFITVAPLIFFGQAARNLPLSTLGLIQYLSPTGQFLLGVLVYEEPLTAVKVWSFVFIWIGLIIYSADALWTIRRRLGRQEFAVPVEGPS
jgi:chloramphenicol-sensitive protein RarD